MFNAGVLNKVRGEKRGEGKAGWIGDTDCKHRE